MASEVDDANRCQGSALAGVSLFEGLSPQELDAIARRGVLRTLRSNTAFIQKGEEASSLYLILSGRVRVYADRREGEHKVLDVLGPGAHLGELALLGDSVRTASAITLEDSTFLVLSRRAFLECLAENPQLALNLDATRFIQTLESHVGSDAAQRYRAWSNFRRNGLSLVLLIGGCTGTGKSTVAAELSLRLDIGRTLSTDILREVVRLFVSRDSAPELHSSTYEVWRSGQTEAAGASGASPLIDGFRAQAARMAPAIDGVIDRSVKEGASTIIEGIHIHPAYHEHLTHEDAVFVPVLLTTPSREQLRSHYCHRDRQAPSRGASRYLRNLELIWQLQTYLVKEAARCGVAVITNVHLDHTVRQVMALITNVLLARLPGQ